ncbi:unnamed protein product [Moneuplotes crassus]|uniref:Uncharacterized protein n=1 Tax=Euplotes crassus TaxID=5936 RepID=A0AAD1UK31_EUPCR|nr:unnamed protein product [Moneuplotes crassus]
MNIAKTNQSRLTCFICSSICSISSSNAGRGCKSALKTPCPCVASFARTTMTEVLSYQIWKSLRSPTGLIASEEVNWSRFSKKVWSRSVS